MKSESRAAMAYIVGRLLTGKNATAVFDYSRSVHVSFSGYVRVGTVQVYDYETRGYISGSGSEFSLGLFDYSRNSHVQLNVIGNQFNGFDYGTGTHFQGTVSGSAIQLYDFGESRYFNYAI